MRAWLEISASALAHNFGAIARAAGSETEVLAVVKADAYGHGAELCAPVLARAGARWFGVTDAAEGARVRLALQAASMHSPEILVMSGSLPEETALLGQHRLTPVVWTGEHVAAVAALRGRPVQLEIDTGMSRQGARPGDELAGLLAALREAGLMLDGVFTHLCSSEVAGASITALQQERFAAAIAQVREAGLRPRWVHIANSSAVDTPSALSPWLAALAASVGARGMVRTGLALYGYTLPISLPGASASGAPRGLAEAAEARLQPELVPVLRWKARVLAVRELHPDDTVGYGATFTAAAAMRVALLPVGYADGLRRELSNPGTAGSESSGGWAVVETRSGELRRCPIVGRVSMNLTVVDVSAAPELAAGDSVTLLGPGVTAADHARLAGTIPYEILCGLRSNERVLTE